MLRILKKKRGPCAKNRSVTAPGLLGSKVVEVQAEEDRRSTWAGRAAGKTRTKGLWIRPRAGSRKLPAP